MIFGDLKYPQEVAKDIAFLEKKKRKKRKLTQAELSERAGISFSPLKRFEKTGEISFVSLIKIADILVEKGAFEELFTSKEYQSIQEVIDEKVFVPKSDTLEGTYGVFADSLPDG